MPQVNIFEWRDGGWLVLAGGGLWDSEDNLAVAGRMLNQTVSQGPIAYIWAATDIESADEHMETLRDLGARTGYLVDLMTESDTSLADQISEAGVIILDDGPRLGEMRDALVGPALRAIEESYQRGATVYAVGGSAALFGAYAAYGDSLLPGLNWLSHSIIVPAYGSERAERLHGWIQQHPTEFGLGLGQGSALALGPRGEVELWGNAAVTVSLGQNYRTGEETPGGG